MKKLFIASLILIFACIIYAQAPEWLWASSAGSVGNDSGWGVAFDTQGNQYLIGRFSETITFGTTTLTSAGARDVWVGKMDNNHNWLWVKQVPGAGDDTAANIAVDGAGNVYITGNFTVNATFGTSTFTCYGNADIFLAKLDTNGNWLWAKQAGGASSDAGWDVVVDSAANVYLTGNYTSTAFFGTLSLTSHGSLDAFVAKLDTDGNWLWAVGAGGTGQDYNYGIGVDNNSNVYVTGTFHGTITFGTVTLSSGGVSIKDSYVAQLDSNGNWMWAVDTANSSHVESYNLTVDSAANVYVTGLFQGVATFGDTQSIASNGGYDIFVAKIDAFGSWLWAKHAGGAFSEYVLWMDTDSAANVYVTGYFEETANFGATSMTSNGGNDIYVAKLDTNGNWLWVKQTGGVGDDHGISVSVDSQANVYVTGSFNETVNFGTFTLTSVGLFDFFVAILGPETGIEDNTTPIESSVSLLFNAYPNPLRSSETTQIKTYIAEKENGNLSVYNLKGQCVAKYELNPGTHDISFDSKGLASGVYLYRLKTQSVNTVKKLVLLK